MGIFKAIKKQTKIATVPIFILPSFTVLTRNGANTIIP